MSQYVRNLISRFLLRDIIQIIVTVWKQEEEKAEIQEHGYLSILQQKSPCQTFRQDLNTFKAQGKRSLSIVFSETKQHIMICSVLNAAFYLLQKWKVEAQNLGCHNFHLLWI